MSISDSIVSKQIDGARSIHSLANGAADASAKSTKQLLAYVLSKVLFERRLFPESCFKERELREGLIVSVFRGPQDSTATQDGVGQHAKSCKKALDCIVPLVNSSADMGDLVLQLFDVKDPQVIYEEWRFEIMYKPLPVPETKERGSVRSVKKPQLQVVPCTFESFPDIVEKAFEAVKKKTDGLKLFDFAHEHKDVRFRIGVSLTDEAAHRNILPTTIFQQAPAKQKTRGVGDLLRLRVGTYDLPFHRFEVKIKSALFKNPSRLDRAAKENQHKKRYW